MKQIAVTRYVSVLLIMALSTVVAGSVQAQTKRSATSSGQRLENRLETIKARGTNAIDARLERLNAITQTLPALKFMPDRTQSALLGEVATTSASLQALKTTLANDVQAEQAVKDYRKVFTNHRVYMVVIPRVRASIVIERMLAHITRLETFGLKLQSRLQKAKDNGADVAAAVGQYDQYRQKVDLAKTKVNTAKTLLPQLTVARANAGTSKQTLQAVKTNLRDAYTAMQAAHQLGQSITSGLSATPKKSSIATQSGSRQLRTATASAKP